jgi:hypothetical protein
MVGGVQIYFINSPGISSRCQNTDRKHIGLQGQYMISRTTRVRIVHANSLNQCYASYTSK